MFFDPLREFHSADENKSDAMLPVIQALRWLQTTTTVVAVHHTAKPNENDALKTVGQRSRGTSALAGAANTVVLVERNGKSKVHKLLFEMKSAEEPDPLAIALDTETWCWQVVGELTAQNVLQAIQQAPGIAKKALSASLHHRKADVLVLLAEMEQNGSIVVVPGPRNAKLLFPSALSCSLAAKQSERGSLPPPVRGG